MPTIYRKTSLDGKHKTKIFYCGDCLDDSWKPQSYPEYIGEGPKHFTGRWEEAPLDQCDVCYAIDQDSRDEYENWSNDMDRMQWEEDYLPENGELK